MIGVGLNARGAVHFLVALVALGMLIAALRTGQLQCDKSVAGNFGPHHADEISREAFVMTAQTRPVAKEADTAEMVGAVGIEPGTLRALAVTTRERDPGNPSVPTVAESGYPGFEVAQWVGLLTTAGTPKEIIDRINAVVNRALRDPDMIEKLKAQGAVGAGGTPQQFGDLISREIKESAEAARMANIRAQ